MKTLDGEPIEWFEPANDGNGEGGWCVLTETNDVLPDVKVQPGIPEHLWTRCDYYEPNPPKPKRLVPLPDIERRERFFNIRVNEETGELESAGFTLAEAGRYRQAVASRLARTAFIVQGMEDILAKELPSDEVPWGGYKEAALKIRKFLYQNGVKDMP